MGGTMQWESVRVMHSAWNANRDIEKSIRSSEMLNRHFFPRSAIELNVYICRFIYIGQWTPIGSDMLREKRGRKREPVKSGKRRRRTVGSRKNTICWNRQNQFCSALFRSAHKSGSKICHCFRMLHSMHTYEIHLCIEINNIKPIQILELTLVQTIRRDSVLCFFPFFSSHQLKCTNSVQGVNIL